MAIVFFMAKEEINKEIIMKKWLLILMLIPGLMHAMALHTDDISSSDVVLLCLHDDLDKKNILKDENSFFEDLEVIQPDVIQDMKKDEDSDEIVISSMPEKPSRKRKALIIASTRIQNNALDTKPTDTAQRSFFYCFMLKFTEGITLKIPFYMP